MEFYSHFNLLMDRSPGFGSTACNYIRPFQTRFRCGSGLHALNLAAYCKLPVRSTKSTRSYLTCTFSACKHRVSGSLSLPSRGSFHLSLTVLCAIGRHPSLALGGGPPCLPAGFLVSCGTLVPASLFRLSFTGLLPSSVGLSRPLQLNFQVHFAGPQPRTSVDVRFGLFPVRSPLLRESFLLSFPPGTEMFQFPGCPPHGLWIHPWVTGHYPSRVPPFGHPRLKAHLRLLVAFRS